MIENEAFTVGNAGIMANYVILSVPLECVKLSNGKILLCDQTRAL